MSRTKPCLRLHPLFEGEEGTPVLEALKARGIQYDENQHLIVILGLSNEGKPTVTEVDLYDLLTEDDMMIGTMLIPEDAPWEDAPEDEDEASAAETDDAPAEHLAAATVDDPQPADLEEGTDATPLAAASVEDPVVAAAADIDAAPEVDPAVVAADDPAVAGAETEPVMEATAPATDDQSGDAPTERIEL
ncbi:MAG: hypothetical protein WC857_03830 [Candidatus Paceibacterota bacterium]|jgi:hypothetical protein